VEPSNHNNEGRETGEEVSLGRLLKRSREERQIELDEVFRVTRIRRHTLEALENERWDELPSQVFVRGFLKTYADFLSLDKERVLELYERISLLKGDKSELLKQMSRRKKRWPLKRILLLVALALIASIVFLRWKDISVVDKTFQYLEAQEPVREWREAAVREEMGDQAEEDKPEAVIKQEYVEETYLTEEDKPVALISQESVEERDLAEVEEIDQQMNEKPLPPQFSLTANVRNRTWIAICVDDQPVEEYLFQPGETFTWNAHKGFDIIVGNAEGINFILNGTKIGPLGAKGKVVRVKLPRAED
jgi:cytoskeleton protein RodZ